MGRSILSPIVPRSPTEEHRTSTPLELFFDLVFVVAIASAGSGLHHALSGGHIADGVISFSLIFFAIWWAWMNFTWFASAYDNDDVPYRLLVFVQMTGALILAAGVSLAFNSLDYTVMTIGYVVMRVALVIQWLRVARHDVHRRKTGLRYSLGISLGQSVWVGLLFIPDDIRMPLMILAILMELAIPIWAERDAQTPWHPEHIIERYGLFTIIVLGESILAASIAIQATASSAGDFGDILTVVGGGLLILFAMWWIYFEQAEAGHLSSFSTGVMWGYGHFFIFSSAAAVGSGIAVVVDVATLHSQLTQTTAHLAVTLPVSVFVLSLWLLHFIPGQKSTKNAMLMPVASALVLASSSADHSLLITGGVLVALITYFETRKRTMSL
jgi:low temperature requirement protein LtrA